LIEFKPLLELANRDRNFHFGLDFHTKATIMPMQRTDLKQYDCDIYCANAVGEMLGAISITAFSPTLFPESDSFRTMVIGIIATVGAVMSVCCVSESEHVMLKVIRGFGFTSEDDEEVSQSMFVCLSL
jgi:hypothetical protein